MKAPGSAMKWPLCQKCSTKRKHEERRRKKAEDSIMKGIAGIAKASANI